MDIGSLMHKLAWSNPLYGVFTSTGNMAVAVAVILFVALGIALYRRNKRASLGLGLGLAAVALLGLFGKALWSSKHTTSTKLLRAGTFLLGAAVFGTFATSTAQDMFQVGSIYEGRWSTVDTYFWLADLVLTCALGLVALYIGGRYLHKNVRVETVDTGSPYWRRVQFSGKQPLNRTAAATATA